jgi:hypothetical protein
MQLIAPAMCLMSLSSDYLAKGYLCTPPPSNDLQLAPACKLRPVQLASEGAQLHCLHDDFVVNWRQACELAA